METDTYGRRGSVAAVWCAVAGLLMATALAAPIGVFEAIVRPYAPVFATAVAVLFVAAWTLGDLAWLFAKLLTRDGLGGLPFNRTRHDAFIWGRMMVMIGLGIVIIIGLFGLV